MLLLLGTQSPSKKQEREDQWGSPIPGDASAGKAAVGHCKIVEMEESLCLKELLQFLSFT